MFKNAVFPCDFGNGYTPYFIPEGNKTDVFPVDIYMRNCDLIIDSIPSNPCRSNAHHHCTAPYPDDPQCPPIAHKTAPKFHRFWTLISSNRMNSRRFLCLISTAFYTRYTVLESRGTNRSAQKSTSNIDRFTHKLEKRGGTSAIVGTTRWRLKLIILLKIR